MPILPPSSSGVGFQVFTQVNGVSGVYADAAARDVYFGANQIEVNRVASNKFLIIKLLDDGGGSIAYQQYTGTFGVANNPSDWLDVTSLVQGETGPAGPTGNSYFFASIASRDTFFGTPPNEGLLEEDLPIVVNRGDEVATTFVWKGETSPVSYDSSLWRVASLESSAGDLFLGKSGASLSSGGEVLNFRSAMGDKRYLAGIEYDDTGSAIPNFWELAAETSIPVASVFGLNFPSPNSLTLAASNDEMVLNFDIRPTSSGELRAEVWLGTDDTGPKVVDAYFTIEPGDVGTVVTIAANDVFVEQGTQFFVQFSGVDLSGGMQLAGPFIGQMTIFLAAGVQIGTNKNILTVDDQPDNVVYVYSEEDFGTVVPATQINALADKTFVLQKPITQTLPLVLPTNSSTQIVTSNKGINTLTYTNASEAQFQGTDASLALFDVSLHGNSTATAFDLDGGVLSIKFPDFNRYSSMGTVQNLVDLFAPGVFFDVIDDGLSMINCATHTFQGCLALALDGNTFTFFKISGSSAGNAQIVDNLFENDEFGSFISVDGATYPTGNTVTIARNPVATPSKFFDGASIDETDTRMFVSGNKGQKNSQIIGDWSVLGNSGSTVVVSPDTYQDINVTGSSSGALIERFSLTDAATGELTYTGVDPFSGFFLASISGLKAGSTEKYTFTIAVNDVVPAGAPEASMEVKNDLVNKVLLGSISLDPLDTVKLQVKGVGTSDDVTIEEVNFDVRG